MTTNKPGSVNQQPLYGCTSCYEECTYPADHLRVYGNECWCDLCWDERRWEFPDQPSWNDLEPYTPALQAECEKLRKDAERYHRLRDRLTGPRFDNLFFLELYNAGCFDHPDDVDEAVDAATQETGHDD